MSDFFPDHDKALEMPGEALLRALDRLTPPKYHMQQRDHVDAGVIAEEAKVATVGQPDTRMAMAMRSLGKMAEAGFVERVKTTDDIAGATIRYRLTQLGERTVMRSWVSEIRAEQRKAETDAASYRADAEELAARLQQTKRELLEARRPFWKKIARVA